MSAVERQIGLPSRPCEVMGIVPQLIEGWIWVYDGGVLMDQGDVIKPTKDGAKQKGLSPRALFPQLGWALRLSTDSEGRKWLNATPEKGREVFGALYLFNSATNRVEKNPLIQAGDSSYGWSNEQGGAAIFPVASRGGNEPRVGGVLVVLAKVLKLDQNAKIIGSSLR